MENKEVKKNHDKVYTKKHNGKKFLIIILIIFGVFIWFYKPLIVSNYNNWKNKNHYIVTKKNTEKEILKDKENKEEVLNEIKEVKKTLLEIKSGIKKIESQSKIKNNFNELDVDKTNNIESSLEKIVENTLKKINSSLGEESKKQEKFNKSHYSSIYLIKSYLMLKKSINSYEKFSKQLLIFQEQLPSSIRSELSPYISKIKGISESGLKSKKEIKEYEKKESNCIITLDLWGFGKYLQPIFNKINFCRVKKNTNLFWGFLDDKKFENALISIEEMEDEYIKLELKKHLTTRESIHYMEKILIDIPDEKTTNNEDKK